MLSTVADEQRPIYQKESFIYLLIFFLLKNKHPSHP